MSRTIKLNPTKKKREFYLWFHSVCESLYFTKLICVLVVQFIHNISKKLTKKKALPSYVDQSINLFIYFL